MGVAFMLAKKRLGPGPRIRRRYLTTFPTLDVFQNYLCELSPSLNGARLDFSWQVRGELYTVTLSFSQTASIADWKLYVGREPYSNLVWEHQTNDVSLIHNLVLTETGYGSKVCTMEGALGTVHDFRDSPEARDSYYVNSSLAMNLQKLFSDGQGKSTQNGECITSFSASTKDNSDLSGKQRPKLVIDSLDLTCGRELFLKFLGDQSDVYSYPAFLFTLEQEYYKAINNNLPLTLVIISFESELCGMHSKVVQECLRKIVGVQRKTDVLAHYEDDKFIVLLPETDISGGKLFATKLERALSCEHSISGADAPVLRPAFGVAELGEYCKTLTALLFAAEQALSKAKAAENRIVSYDSLFLLSPLPWNDQDGGVERSTISARAPNLAPLQDMLRHLISPGYGIFTFPAFLIFLEREFLRAARSKSDLFVLLLKLGKSEGIQPDGVSALLPDSVIVQSVKQIMKIKREGDIFAHYHNDSFIMIRRDASICSLENFAKRATQVISAPATVEEEGKALIPQLYFQICAVERHPTETSLMKLVAVD